MKTVSLFLGDSPDELPHEVRAAIGYLSLWGDYPNISIQRDGKTDLIAIYGDADHRTRFVMGAIYDLTSKRYSFHS